MIRVMTLSIPIRHRPRRPSGRAAPLPHNIGRTGHLWLAAASAVLATAVASVHNASLHRAIENADHAVLREIAKLRTGWLTAIAQRVDDVTGEAVISLVTLALVATMCAVRRWRHLLTLLGCLAVVGFIGKAIDRTFTRARPFGVRTIGDWNGFAMPARSIAMMMVTLLGVAYALVPAGAKRDLAKRVIAIVAVVVVAARLYLAVDHPTDLVLAIVLAVATSVAAFRTFAPEAVFPINYRGGKKAHLALTDERRHALSDAIGDQLGFEVLGVEPVGLAGSAGSTPLRLRVAGDPDYDLFGKLYAMSHVRADRWYKLARTVLYGRLEDEAPFQSVRRLVEYEDYAARVLRDAGVPTADTFGVVEIVAEREYVLVTEFYEGAREMGDAKVDVDVVDEALLVVRQLWDAGLAHRDIKPANMMVRDGRVFLIAAFFVPVRPSRWRQSVDLANMMLVLALRTDAPTVYERAMRLFSADDIAEAFAGTRGIACPTQLRHALKDDSRDLVGEFRALAPARQQMALQRWSMRRVLLATTVLAVAALTAAQLANLLRPDGTGHITTTAMCADNDTMILMAQAIPSVTSLPCITAIPSGWSVHSTQIRRGRIGFTLDSSVGGERVVEVSFESAKSAEHCQAADSPRLQTSYVAGACRTIRIDLDETATQLRNEIDAMLSTRDRALLAEHVYAETGLQLCDSHGDDDCAAA
jgi:hypothetical protein